MRQLILFCLVFTSLLLLGQQSLPAGQNFYDNGKVGIVYNSELSFDFKVLTPRAFAFGVNIGDIKAYNRTRFYNIEFGNLRHSQEVRQNFDFQIPINNRISRAFVFGKQNNAYVLRAAIGEKRYFSEKAKNKGLAVGLSYAIGPNLTFLKPYYLELRRFNDGQSVLSDEKYSLENEEFFLDVNKSQTIIGGSAFSKGLNEISVMPGVSGKVAIHFDWGAFDEYVKAIEAGIMVDAYLKDVPIMVESNAVPHLENSPIFINLYINLQLGKRK